MNADSIVAIVTILRDGGQLDAVAGVGARDGPRVAGEHVLQIVLLILHATVPHRRLATSRHSEARHVPLAAVAGASDLPHILRGDDGDTAEGLLVEAKGEVKQLLLDHALGVGEELRTAADRRDGARHGGSAKVSVVENS